MNSKPIVPWRSRFDVTGMTDAQRNQAAHDAREAYEAELRARIAELEGQQAMIVKAAKQVLSDIDDDGVAERHDMGVHALRKAVKLGPAEEVQSAVACAKRVYLKFGAESDWTEWRDLGDALNELDNWALRP